MLLDQQLAANKCLCNTQTQRSDVKHLNKTLEHKSETFEVCSSTGAQPRNAHSVVAHCTH